MHHGMASFTLHARTTELTPPTNNRNGGRFNRKTERSRAQARGGGRTPHPLNGPGYFADSSPHFLQYLLDNVLPNFILNFLGYNVASNGRGQWVWSIDGEGGVGGAGGGVGGTTAGGAH